MKKTIALTLVLLFVFSFGGCNEIVERESFEEPTELESFFITDTDLVSVTQYDYPSDNISLFPWKWVLGESVVEEWFNTMEYELCIFEECDTLKEFRNKEYLLSYIGEDIYKSIICVEDEWYLKENGEWYFIKEYVPIPEGKTLTMESLIELSKKGEKLTEMDFWEYKAQMMGSGIIRPVYSIDNEYTFTIFLGDMLLHSHETGKEIDIRTESIEEFIK